MSWSCCCWEVVADLCGWWVTETNDSTHAFCPSTNHACHMAYLAGCWEVLCHDTNNAFNAPSSLSLLFLIYLSFFFNPSFCFFATLSISDIGIIIAMKIRTWHWAREMRMRERNRWGNLWDLYDWSETCLKSLQTKVNKSVTVKRAVPGHTYVAFSKSSACHLVPLHNDCFVRC